MKEIVRDESLTYRKMLDGLQDEGTSIILFGLLCSLVYELRLEDKHPPDPLPLLERELKRAAAAQRKDVS
jgi:hypothetical protein